MPLTSSGCTALLREIGKFFPFDPAECIRPVGGDTGEHLGELSDRVFKQQRIVLLIQEPSFSPAIIRHFDYREIHWGPVHFDCDRALSHILQDSGDFVQVAFGFFLLFQFPIDLLAQP